uniref:Uncharacterized protein n=1 Tax=Pyramimonas orientalis virus TaxID=455367 RepID=A0A7M3UP31_POV01|nr:hypothetical protein HWQ62_00353 [Pyramimonas orientalis virus]
METDNIAVNTSHDEHAHDEHCEDEHAHDEHCEDEHTHDEHCEDEHAHDEHCEDEHCEDEHAHDEHCEDEHCEDEESPSLTSYVKGERIKYFNETGTVVRTNILGMKPCCAIQIMWDDENKKSKILQMHELCNVVKL